jgi:hypothetical protein
VQNTLEALLLFCLQGYLDASKSQVGRKGALLNLKSSLFELLVESAVQIL